MGLYNFFIYFILPTFALLLIFTNKYYYSKKQSQKMRFNMGDGVFFANIISPIVGLLIVLGLYTQILDIKFIGQIRWELLSILAITMLSLILGIGIGGHITAISIERTVSKQELNDEFQRVLYFFHMPFGHIMTFVPATLIFYLLILLDLFKGRIVAVTEVQLASLTIFAILLGLFATATIIITHVTRVMLYTMVMLSATVFIALGAESITLLEHGSAYFFTILFVTCVFSLAIYRNIHFISSKAHKYIQSKFKDGDIIKSNLEDDS